MNNSSIAGLIAVVFTSLLVIVIGPLITICALNNLFPSLHIPITLMTWASALWIGAVIKGNVSVTKKD